MRTRYHATVQDATHTITYYRGNVWTTKGVTEVFDFLQKKFPQASLFILRDVLTGNEVIRSFGGRIYLPK